jgi:quercetin dioxygenase-like cupin family protein
MNRIDWNRVASTPMPAENGTILRQFVHGDQMTVAKITFSSGASLPAHRHHNEQFTMVLSGKMEFTIDGQILEINAGEVVHLKSESLHGARALEDSILLDMFAPPRADWKVQ